MARQRYAGDVKPVELKQRIQETTVAHPEHVEARSEVGEATKRRDDDHGDHGGANSTTAMLQRLRWRKWSINQAQSTTASRRS